MHYVILYKHFIAKCSHQARARNARSHFNKLSLAFAFARSRFQVYVVKNRGDRGSETKGVTNTLRLLRLTAASYG